MSDNVAAIIKGLRQAWAFRQNREADEGLLEVFDLRKDKKVNLMNEHIVADVLAKFAPPPSYCLRPLFGSSEDARSAGYSGF